MLWYLLVICFPNNWFACGAKNELKKLFGFFFLIYFFLCVFMWIKLFYSQPSECMHAHVAYADFFVRWNCKSSMFCINNSKPMLMEIIRTPVYVRMCIYMHMYLYVHTYMLHYHIDDAVLPCVNNKLTLRWDYKCFRRESVKWNNKSYKISNKRYAPIRF